MGKVHSPCCVCLRATHQRLLWSAYTGMREDYFTPNPASSPSLPLLGWCSKWRGAVLVSSPTLFWKRVYTGWWCVRYKRHVRTDTQSFHWFGSPNGPFGTGLILGSRKKRWWEKRPVSDINCDAIMRNHRRAEGLVPGVPGGKKVYFLHRILFTPLGPLQAPFTTHAYCFTLWLFLASKKKQTSRADAFFNDGSSVGWNEWCVVCILI